MADSKGSSVALVTTTPESVRARWKGRAMWFGLFAAVAAAGALALKSQQEREAALALQEFEGSDGGVQASVVRHLRTCDLVTSRIDTTVRAQISDDNWFGTVVATVEAPARLSYGVDLSKLESSKVVFSPIGGVYSIKVPAPRRIATEVFTGKETTDVALAGLRFRALAGEEKLGLARARLHEQALRVRISGPELDRVREGARAEIEGLVKRIAGENAAVRVAFEDEWGTTARAGE